MPAGDTASLTRIAVVGGKGGWLEALSEGLREISDPAQQIQAIISFATKHDPSMAILDVFRPKTSVPCQIFLELLSFEAGPYGFSVLDPNGLDISHPEVSISEELQSNFVGLVLPFHINDKHQQPTEDKNYWALAVADWKEGRFATFGIDEELSGRWKAAIDKELGITLVAYEDVVSMTYNYYLLLY